LESDIIFAGSFAQYGDGGLETRRRPSGASSATSRRSNKTGSTMLDLLQDLWGYMRENKKYWLAPIIIVMVLLGGLIVFAQGSAVAPFIYTLF
jgi:hypothetical protein